MRCAQFQQVQAPQPRPCRPILLRCLANGGWCPGLECHDQARPTTNPQTIERISFSGLCTRLERLERLAFWGWFWYVTGAAQVLCANAPIGCIPCSNEYLVGQTNLPNAHGAAKLHRFSRKPKTGSLETPPPPVHCPHRDGAGNACDFEVRKDRQHAFSWVTQHLPCDTNWVG